MIKTNLKQLQKDLKKCDNRKDQMSEKEISDVLITLDQLKDELSAYVKDLSSILLTRDDFDGCYNLHEQIKVLVANNNSVVTVNTNKVFKEVKDDKNLLRAFIKSTKLDENKATKALKSIIEKHKTVSPGTTRTKIKISKMSKRDLLKMAKE